MTSLGPFDWLIFGGYIFIVFALGVCFARGQHTNEDYFVGGRKMNWMAVGLSLFAGTFSSLSFVGLPREAAYADYHLYLAILFIPFVVTPVLWVLIVPLYLRLGLISVYEYLERRFNRPLRRLGSLLYACYSIGWMGSMLFAVGVILQVVLNLSDTQLTWSLIGLGLVATLYTSMGGVKAVIWTDVLQALTLGGGMLFVLMAAVGRIDGGWSTFQEIALRDHKLDMFHFDFDFSRPNFYAACAFGIFVYLASHTTSFGAVQRYVSMPNLAAARRALVVNGVMVGLVCGLFFVVGTALYVVYHQSPGGEFPELLKQDQLVPHFVMGLHQAGLTGLLLAGLFAAAMSSVDTGINSLTAMLIYDWLDGRDFGMGFSRVMCAVFGATVIVSALLVPYLGKNVFDIIIKISGTFFGPLLAVFLLGMLVPWANGAGALAGLVAGAISLAFVWQIPEVSHWWYGAFTCIPTFVVGFFASLFFPRPRRDQLEGLCVWYRSEPTQ